MFCPRCGVESTESQKFCKGCGTSLQIVSDALDRGEDTLGQLRIDIEGMKRNLSDAFKGIKHGKMRGGRYRGVNFNKDFWSKFVQYDKGAPTSPSGAKTAGATTKELAKEQGSAQMTQQNQWPFNDTWEWLPYTRQHSMMRGLGSLFGGLATGAVLYLLGHQLIESGTISRLEDMGHIQGIATFVSLFWIVGAIPVAKGLAQIIYGLLFAESIKTMTSRLYSQASVRVPTVPSPQEIEAPAPAVSFSQSPPVSVTERTTNIMGGPRGVQNAQ